MSLSIFFPLCAFYLSLSLHVVSFFVRLTVILVEESTQLKCNLIFANHPGSLWIRFSGVGSKTSTQKYGEGASQLITKCHLIFSLLQSKKRRILKASLFFVNCKPAAVTWEPSRQHKNLLLGFLCISSPGPPAASLGCTL